MSEAPALDAAPCGVLSFTDDGRITYANATLLALVHAPAGERPARLAELLTLGSRLSHQNYVAPMLLVEGRADEVALTLRRRDGAEVPVLASAVRRRGEDGIAVTDCAMLPMGRRHAFEREPREARRQAEAASQAKSTFLGMMSHELRTPLNAIIGFTQQVRKNREGGIPARDLTYLERVENNGRRLLALINDVLDLSKIEAARLTVQLETVDVARVVLEVLGELEAHPRGAGVRLAAELPEGMLPLHTDPLRLRQVLVNLVGNALKFTDAGHVLVVVEACGETGAVRAIEVRDTGIGIAPDRLDAVFRPFEQAEGDTTRRYGGTGLGLAIARDLCELLGARLSVESVMGRGTSFRITLGAGALAA